MCDFSNELVAWCKSFYSVGFWLQWIPVCQPMVWHTKSLTNTVLQTISSFLLIASKYFISAFFSLAVCLVSLSISLSLSHKHTHNIMYPPASPRCYICATCEHWEGKEGCMDPSNSLLCLTTLAALKCGVAAQPFTQCKPFLYIQTS